LRRHARLNILNIYDQMDDRRDYDLVLYGATGYTGNYTAEWLQQNAPTDLKWAIAGRNADKLHALAAALKELSPDRLQPGTKPLLCILKRFVVVSRGVGLLNAIGEKNYDAELEMMVLTNCRH
jgi:short subunit dehydrogenase-like uncharacterized protein